MLDYFLKTRYLGMYYCVICVKAFDIVIQLFLKENSYALAFLQNIVNIRFYFSFFLHFVTCSLTKMLATFCLTPFPIQVFTGCDNMKLYKKVFPSEIHSPNCIDRFLDRFWCQISFHVGLLMSDLEFHLSNPILLSSLSSRISPSSWQPDFVCQ